MTFLKFTRSIRAATVVFAAFLLWTCGAVFSSEGAVAPKFDPEQIRVARKLIDGLDSDNFLVREKARECLLKLGRPAIELLEDASKSKSSEVRLRALELLLALRGRGLLGIQMFVWPMDKPTAYGAGVKLASPKAPAEKAGLQSGDIILALNGEPVEGNDGLMRCVFSAGPARVMDVTVERDGEKYHFPVLLTLNLSGGYVSPETGSTMPLIDLESELPESENPKGRQEVRAQIVQQITRVVNGQLILEGAPDLQAAQAASQRLTNQNAKALESEFDKVKAEVEKKDGEQDAPAVK